MTNYKAVLVLMAMSATLLALGQPPAPPATPIDGGLGLLLAGGVAYGLKTIRDRKK